MSFFIAKPQTARRAPLAAESAVTSAAPSSTASPAPERARGTCATPSKALIEISCLQIHPKPVPSVSTPMFANYLL